MSAPLERPETLMVVMCLLEPRLRLDDQVGGAERDEAVRRRKLDADAPLAPVVLAYEPAPPVERVAAGAGGRDAHIEREAVLERLPQGVRKGGLVRALVGATVARRAA